MRTATLTQTGGNAGEFESCIWKKLLQKYFEGKFFITLPDLRLYCNGARKKINEFAEGS